VPCAVGLAVGGPLVALGVHEQVSFLVEKRVYRVLDRLAHQLADV